MRSRREEYIASFEELTKQEIIKYNDSLLHVHQSLEGFRRDLEGVVDQYAKQIAYLSSLIKKVEATNIDLKVEVKSLTTKLERQTHDLTALERKLIESDRKAQQFDDSVNKRFDLTQASFDRLQTNMVDAIPLIERRIEGNLHEVSVAYRKSKSDNDKLREEILAIPSEAKKVEGELLKKIAEMSVDNSGIDREISMLKKKATVQESMNEYFHTRLDRLTEGKKQCPSLV